MQYFDHDVVAYLEMGLGDDLGPILDPINAPSLKNIATPSNVDLKINVTWEVLKIPNVPCLVGNMMVS